MGEARKGRRRRRRRGSQEFELLFKDLLLFRVKRRILTLTFDFFQDQEALFAHLLEALHGGNLIIVDPDPLTGLSNIGDDALLIRTSSFRISPTLDLNTQVDVDVC